MQVNISLKKAWETSVELLSPSDSSSLKLLGKSLCHDALSLFLICVHA